MNNSLVTVTDGITSGVTEVRERVLKLLSLIPKYDESSRNGLEVQRFYRLRLISPEGVRFAFSIQGSGVTYAYPKRNLENLTKYEELEVGIQPDERNRTPKFKFGTTYDFDLEGRRQVKEGECISAGYKRSGWLMPSDIGFTRLKDSPNDDVLPYVALDDIVADLADFFLRGGVIDGDDKETKEWIGRLLKALKE